MTEEPTLEGFAVFMLTMFMWMILWWLSGVVSWALCKRIVMGKEAWQEVTAFDVMFSLFGPLVLVAGALNVLAWGLVEGVASADETTIWKKKDKE